MKFKVIDKAKETWSGLKEQQQAYVFQAVWFGKLVPGMPVREQVKVKGLINKIKQRLGKFPGLIYEQIHLDIADYKQRKISEEELREKLFKFYPICSTLTLKVSREDLAFNKQMRCRLMTITDSLLDEVAFDLKRSEERDKAKVLATI